MCFPLHLLWSLVLADLIDLRVIEFQIFLTIPGSVIQLQWVCVLRNIEWTFCAHERRWFFSREYPPTDSKVLTTTIARVPNRYQPVHEATCFKCSSENQKPVSTRRGHLAYLRGRPSREPAASPLHDQSGDIGYSSHSLACSSLVSDSLSQPPVLRMRSLCGKASQHSRHWEERLSTTFLLLWQGEPCYTHGEWKTQTQISWE